MMDSLCWPLFYLPTSWVRVYKLVERGPAFVWLPVGVQWELAWTAEEVFINVY